MNSQIDSDSNTKDNATQKKELPPNLQKICQVCGDKALGYNFNAISCESCKAFFRRNALTSKEFKCPFTNNCEITIVTRRFCQKCRLEKCFSVGMVKEFIMSEEDKAEKRRKIEENRVKKRQLRESEETVSSSKHLKREEEVPIPQEQSIVQYDVPNSTTCSPNSTVQSSVCNDLETSIHSPPFNQYVPVQTTDHPYTMKVYPLNEKSHYDERFQYNDHDQSQHSEKTHYDQRLLESCNMCDSMISIDSNMYSEIPKPSIRSILSNGDTSADKAQHVCEQMPSTSNNDDANKAKEILQDIERIEPNSMESILCEAIKLEFEAYTSISRCNGSSRELNEVERAKLNELIVANKALHVPIDDDLSQLIGESPCVQPQDGNPHDPRLVTVVNLTAVAIRRFIKLAKKINAFKNMCEEDQVALLKGGCIEMMVLRSAMAYDGQRNQWTVPHSQYGTIRTDVLKLAKGNIYRTHEAFISSFAAAWRTDEHVILVMTAILLFSPERANLVHRDVIKLEQNSYYYLLRRYLESVYPGCEAKSTFLKLIQKILELRKLAEEVTEVCLNVNPIEPLLMEIFDLKHHAT